VQQGADAAAEATASGQTFRDWQRAVLTTDKGGELLSLGRARRELIFRNAVQTHYGIGRTIQQRENAAARPFLMWDAINDSRTRPTHRAMDGHIAPIDAPIWKRWNAPAGFSCRCTRISLTEAQARARGHPKADPGVEPDKGWEGDPTEGNEDLVRIIRARRNAQVSGSRKPLASDSDVVQRELEKALDALQAPPGAAPVFVEQKTAKAAAEYAVKAGLADFADYTGIKPEVANAWNRSLFDHISEFPELRKNQRFVGTAQAQFARYANLKKAEVASRLVGGRGMSQADAETAAARLVKTPKVKGNAFAQSWKQPEASGVAVNAKWGKDPGAFLSQLAKDVNSAFHPAGTDTIRAVADHELGHQLDDLLNLRVDNEINLLYQKHKSKGMKHEVSGYATNIVEFIAECWAESCNSAAPRDAAKSLAEIVRARYRSRFPVP
jgi:SPP1 gp7 family putative phage head morphogenesis protein